MVLMDERVVVPVPEPFVSARTFAMADVLTMAEDTTAVTCPPFRSTARRLADGSSVSSTPPTLSSMSWARSRATHFSAAARAVRVAAASVAEVVVAAAHACCVAALDVRVRAKVGGSRRSTCCGIELIDGGAART